jgi:hypothetical protein
MTALRFDEIVVDVVVADADIAKKITSTRLSSDTVTIVCVLMAGWSAITRIINFPLNRFN